MGASEAALPLVEGINLDAGEILVVVIAEGAHVAATEEDEVVMIEADVADMIEVDVAAMIEADVAAMIEAVAREEAADL